MAAPDPSRAIDESRRLWRLSGMGVELAAMVVAGVVIGILLDWWLGWTPWGLVVGATLGVAIGMTQFIRRALLLNRAAVKEYRRTHPAGLPPLSDNDDNDDEDDA